MTAYRWLKRETVDTLHERQLAQHGGGSGLRDESLLLSALVAPETLAYYSGTEVDIFSVAARYATGIVGNHPYVDGNKRTGFLAAALFLQLNGYRFQATESDVVERTLALASGSIGADEYAEWLRANSVRR